MRPTIPYPLQDEDEPPLSKDRANIGQRRCEKQSVPRRKAVQKMRQEKRPHTNKGWMFPFAAKKQRSSLFDSDSSSLIKAPSPAIYDNSTLVDTGDKIVMNRSRNAEPIRAAMTKSQFVPFIPNKWHERPVSTHRVVSKDPLDCSAAGLVEGSSKVSEDSLGRVLSLFILVTVVAIFSSITGQLIEAVKDKTGLK
ncbi:LAFA_0B07712g1_1 [Lachancea sp. 'fantastica']|nr:LAFA_0B07712g1_1 [Lachancea sp. 'fantastica']